MASIILPSRWQRQPSGQFEIDWRNELTRDLAHCYVGGDGYHVNRVTGQHTGTLTGRMGSEARPDALATVGTGSAYMTDTLNAPTGLPLSIGVVAGARPNGNGPIFGSFTGGSVGSAVAAVGTGFIGNAYPEYSIDLDSGVIVTDTDARSSLVNTDRAYVCRSNSATDHALIVGRRKTTNTTARGVVVANAQVGLGRAVRHNFSAGSLAATAWFSLACMWFRGLDDAEAFEFNAAPWQIFRPRRSVLYFDTGVAPTTVTSDLTDNYAVRNIVSSDIADNYVVRNIITSDLTDSYALRSAVTTDLTDSYTLTNFVQTDLTDSYALRSVVTSDLTDSYTLTNFVQTDLTDSYALRSAVTSDLTDSYALRSAVTSDLTDSYDIVVAGTVTSDHTDTYTVRNTVISDHDDTYSVHNVVNSDFVDMYSLRNFVQNDIADSYTLTNFVQTDYSDNYDLHNLVNNDFVDSYLLRNVTLSDISDSYAIYAYIQNDIADSYIVNSDAPFTQVQLDYLLAYMQENLMIPTAEEIAAAILAAAQLTPIHADIQKVNNVDVGGTGSELDPWGPQ